MFLKLNRNLIITGISLIILLLDQASKQIILNYLISNKIYVCKITNFLNFVEIWNKGISFGIFSEYNLSPILFICLSSIILFELKKCANLIKITHFHFFNLNVLDFNVSNAV